MKDFNVAKINAAVKELKKENPTHFFNMYQFDQSGIGPGELLLYFLGFLEPEKQRYPQMQSVD